MAIVNRLATEANREALRQSGRFPAIHTEILPSGRFWVAEEYHQNYHKNNPLRYNYYRLACGRDARVKELWGSDIQRSGVAAGRSIGGVRVAGVSSGFRAPPQLLP